MPTSRLHCSHYANGRHVYVRNDEHLSRTERGEQMPSKLEEPGLSSLAEEVTLNRDSFYMLQLSISVGTTWQQSSLHISG